MYPLNGARAAEPSRTARTPAEMHPNESSAPTPIGLLVAVALASAHTARAQIMPFHSSEFSSILTSGIALLCSDAKTPIVSLPDAVVLVRNFVNRT